MNVFSVKYSLCRLCLCSGHALMNIFDESMKYDFALSDTIEDLLRFEVTKEEGFPWMICDCCFEKVKDFRLFKVRCRECKVAFESRYQNKEHPSNISWGNTKDPGKKAQPSYENTNTDGDTSKGIGDPGISTVHERTHTMVPILNEPTYVNNEVSIKEEVDSETEDTLTETLTPISNSVQISHPVDFSVQEPMQLTNSEETRREYVCTTQTAGINGQLHSMDIEEHLQMDPRRQNVYNCRFNNHHVVRINHEVMRSIATVETALLKCVGEGDIDPNICSEFGIEPKSNSHQVGPNSMFSNASGTLADKGKPIFQSGSFLQCHQCGKVFSRFCYLKKHLKIHDPLRKYECSICFEKFLKKKELKYHSMVHVGERPYVCHVCGQRFLREKYLRGHLRTHSGEKPFECKVCAKRFSQPYSLDIHMSAHSNDKPFLCEICGCAFRHRAFLGKHRRVHERQTYGCDRCHRFFTMKRTLSLHIAGHNSVKLIVCPVCGKRFTTNSCLKDHTRSHTGERPFKCTVCDKTYGWSSNLTQHMRKVHRHELEMEKNVASLQISQS